MRKYWSIQTLDAWNNAVNIGYLEGNPNHISFEDFEVSYSWMRRQMKKRISGYKNKQPVWLWLKKPDMRHSAHHNTGTKIVRLTLELKEESVLLSDFDKWHCVLNDDFCSDTELEDEDYRENKLAITKEESWERIFELDRTTDGEWWGNQENLILQGTTGRIALHAIMKVEHFIAR